MNGAMSNDERGPIKGLAPGQATDLRAGPTWLPSVQLLAGLTVMFVEQALFLAAIEAVCPESHHLLPGLLLGVMHSLLEVNAWLVALTLAANGVALLCSSFGPSLPSRRVLRCHA
jgi:hypothetical protein